MKHALSIKTILLAILGYLPLQAQYPCANENFASLSWLIGDWRVETLDRVRPDEYENNSGYSSIDAVFDSCGFEEHFEGQFKGSIYAFKTVMLLGDSSSIKRLWTDSHHGGMMLLAGFVDSDSLVTFWERQLKTRKLRVKHIYRFISQAKFTVESFMSPREGSEWQLTHRRTYIRKETQ